MASKSKIHVVDDKSVLDNLLRGPLPLDTDGLSGLVDAPTVYDLILRDLQDNWVLMSSEAGNDPSSANTEPPDTETADVDRDGETGS